MIGVLLAVACITLLIQELFTRWKALKLREELGLSGPPADLFLGNWRFYNKIVNEKGLEGLPHIFTELEQEYGNTYGLYLGSYLEIMTTDPQIIKEVFISQFGNFIDRRNYGSNKVYPMLDGLLQVDHTGSYAIMLKSEGVGWKEIRSTISVMFTSASMKKAKLSMHANCHDLVDNLVEVLHQKSRLSNGRIDAYAEYQAMTMDMIARCAIGVDLSCIGERNNDFYRYARIFFSNMRYEKSLQLRAALTFEILRFLRPITKYGRAERILISKLSAVVKQRQQDRAEGIIRSLPDVIDLMLAENEKRVLNGKTPFHHDVIVSNAWALFIAGYETTSSALSYASYLLAKHPEAIQAQATLYDEVMSTFGSDQTIDYERVMKLPYMHAVFSEVLRLYPPVVTLTGRTCIKETVVGGKIRVPVGVAVVTPVQTVMWSGQNFDRPTEFIPERFLNDKAASAWSATYLPFGIGPRNCVGARFAEMEFKTVLAAVIRRFAFELDPEHKELKTIIGNVLLSPKNDELFIRIVERQPESDFESLKADLITVDSVL